MSQSGSRLRVGRRQFLWLAGASTAAAGSYLLAESAPWVNYEAEAARVWEPLKTTLTGNAQMRELVRAATLAASGHNSQPWTFTIREGAIDIRPDSTRRLPIVDPFDRELWISLGCALENLLIAARAVGYTTVVTYPGETDVIRVALTPDTPQTSPLFVAIPLRQNTRSPYDGQSLPTREVDQLQALALEPGITLHLVTGTAGLETILEYVTEGNQHQSANQAFLDELIAWLRFNQREAVSALDGLYTRASGNAEVPRWLGQMFVASNPPQQQSDRDAKNLRSSAGAVVVASATEDKAAWVRTGQVYERLALTMTTLNVKSAFLNQPIEVADVRPQFQAALSLGASVPQLLLRYGYAAAMPRSLRRPVAQVVV